MDVEKICEGVMSMPRPSSKASRKDAKYNQELAERIKAVRKSRGLTQAGLAERIGETQRALSHYEMGQRRLPAETLLKIAQTLRVPMTELTNGKYVSPPKNGRKVRAIVEKIETLPPKKQQQVVDYIAFISQNGQRVAA